MNAFAKKVLGSFLLGFYFLGFTIFNSCKEAEVVSLTPEIEISGLTVVSGQEAELKIKTVNTENLDLELGLLLTSVDSMDNGNYYNQTLDALKNLKDIDLFLNDANLLKGRSRIINFGKPGVNSEKDSLIIALDSLHPNNTYILRAFLKNQEVFVYSKAVELKTSEYNALQFVTELEFPFNPESFHFINNKLYVLGVNSPSVFNNAFYSYDLNSGGNSYTPLAVSPVQNLLYPQSFFSVVDNNLIEFYAQQNGTTPNSKVYHRASYNTITDQWTNHSATCTLTDTNRFSVNYGYKMAGKLIVSLNYGNGNYKTNTSQPADFCPTPLSQNLILNCSDLPDYASGALNSIFYNDTVLIPAKNGTKINYLFSLIQGANPTCGQIDFDSTRINPSMLFANKGFIHSIKKAKNPVSGKPELFVNKLNLTNFGTQALQAINLSKTPIAETHERILTTGTCRSFKEINGTTWMVVTNPALSNNKIYLFKYTKP